MSAPVGSSSRLPIRESLHGLVAYGAPQIDVPVRLNTNENPFSPSASLVADITNAVRAAATDLNRYPDRDAVDLRSDLASYLTGESGARLCIDNIWAANGSNEIMLQILELFGGPGRSALSFTPTYAMYEEYCRTTSTAYVTCPRDDDFRVDISVARVAVLEHRPTVVFLTSPNNPTGTSVDIDDIERVLAAASEVGAVVVVDEAYAEFRAAGRPSVATLVDRHQHLVVTRTMSKAFGLAGARVGYLAASAEIVSAIQLVRLPYHLSSVTQVTARAALRHAVDLRAQILVLREERDLMIEELRCTGHRVADSDANFVLFGLFDDRHAVWQGLLDRGVLVRETGPPGWLRVTIGTPEENRVFRAALTETVQSRGGRR